MVHYLREVFTRWGRRWPCFYEPMYPGQGCRSRVEGQCLRPHFMWLRIKLINYRSSFTINHLFNLKWVRLNRLPCAVIAVSPGLDKTNSPSATAQTSLHLRVPNICSLSDWLNCSVGGSWRCNTGVHRSRRFPLCCLCLRVIIVFVA